MLGYCTTPIREPVSWLFRWNGYVGCNGSLYSWVPDKSNCCVISLPTNPVIWSVHSAKLDTGRVITVPTVSSGVDVVSSICHPVGSVRANLGDRDYLWDCGSPGLYLS